MTDEQADRIVEELLKLKAKWIEEEKKPKKKVAADSNLSLGDLDL